jgi:AAA15 family ATPase/GTPase
MIPSLEIENYRLFRKLRIPKLAQVNLVGGKNNCGKTALLEAIRILESEGDNTVLTNILEYRGERVSSFTKKISAFFNKTTGNSFFKVNNIYLKIDLDKEKISKFYIIDFQKQLAANEEYNQKINKIQKEENELDSNQAIRLASEAHNKRNDFIISSTTYFSNDVLQDKVVYVPFTIENTNNNELWSNIALTPREDNVLEILQIIEPRIKKFRLDTGKASVLLQGEDEPKPLKNLGDGANRILTIALALVNAKDTILLIDEFEVGLHHSVQQQLWEIIFKYAKRWNIQVFATTHSLDTLRAFSYVNDQADYEGMGQYLRLEKSRESDDIEAVIYDKALLNTSLDHNFETR